LVQDVEDLLMPEADRKGIAFTHHVDANVPMQLRWDPVRARQILTNLVGNAVKFTDVGSVSVTLSCESTGPDDALVLRGEVVDTGIGLSPDECERLFQPFVQADVSTTRKFGGTGLGLVISKRLVEMMGGRIGVESTPGVGSRFWFTANVLRAEDDGALLAPVQPAVPVVPAVLPPGCRVLVAEDNDVNRQVATAMLLSMKCDVRSVPNGAAALDAVAGGAFDVVLMDCQMPVMDGLEATRQIRQLATPQSTTPIVALTANAIIGDRDKCIAAGMNDYLSKPFSRDDLMRVLSANWKRQA
jgi:CheY-like chemotaxis protein